MFPAQTACLGAGSPTPAHAATLPPDLVSKQSAAASFGTHYPLLARPKRPHRTLARLKARVRTRSPRPLYDLASRTYRTALGLPKLVRLVRRHGLPRRILYFGVAPGDDLLCTPALAGLGRRESEPIHFLSHHLELLAGLKGALRLVPFHAQYLSLAQALGASVQRLEYAAFDEAADRSVPPTRHIIAELCRQAGLRGRVALKPLFFSRPEELEAARWAEHHLVIQSSGLGGAWPMQNKQWYPERFQAVVDALRAQWRFVQLGSLSDPPLTGTVDLRGRTTLRQSAAILANARLYLGNVGFLMHLARAVDCPAVILYGGREAPWQSGYTCNVNLYSPVPCAPCWLWNRCEYGRICMDQITVADVLQAVRQQLDRPRGPLVVDFAEV